MKSALVLLIGSMFQVSCAITQSASCRRAAEGDVPCQNLSGTAFQRCQVDFRQAQITCQTEQMHNNPDSVGVYHLPPTFEPALVPQVAAPLHQSTPEPVPSSDSTLTPLSVPTPDMDSTAAVPDSSGS